MARPIAQLRDEGWLRQTAGEPLDDLARRLQCQPGTVQKARQRAGVYHKPRPWNPVECGALRHFYGRVLTHHLARALNRGKPATHKKALGMGLSGRHALRDTGETQARFWDDWRSFIAANWPAWAREGLAPCALNLIWRPAGAYSGPCDICDLLTHCRRIPTPLPLHCERVTVEELLRLDPRDRRLILARSSNSQALHPVRFEA